jgi:hypothetical protein
MSGLLLRCSEFACYKWSNLCGNYIFINSKMKLVMQNGDEKMEKWQNISLLESALSTSGRILSSNFYEVDNPSFLSEACFMMLMVSMKDALMLLSELGRRISFNEDLPRGVDVTKAIVDMRNAICHLGSRSRRAHPNGIFFSYGRVVGKGILAKIYDVELSNEYEDDVAFFYGSQRLLLKRHLVRACNEAIIQAKNYAESVGLPIHFFPE